VPPTLVNPPALHDPVPFGCSHVATARGELVFVGGQYGSDPTGQPVPGGFDVQVETALAHLGTALAAVGLGYRDVVRIGTFIVDHDVDKLTVLGGHLHRIWGDQPPPQTLIGVSALALPGMLFEVDAVAVRG
jgi:enamine deaminase RidA (YjgF/YER057c/UK114 family)